jgi:hypothetical protein
MPRKSYRKHKRGGSHLYVSETKMGNPKLPYAAPIKYGGRRHRKRSMRGGSPYSSAATYGEYVNGSENSQYDRTFLQTGPYGNVPGNLLIGREGQWSQEVGAPSAASLKLIQSAGSKRRRHRKGSRHTKKRRGGNIGQVLNQAVVPFGLLAMQQSYRRKHRHGKSKSRRRYK